MNRPYDKAKVGKILLPVFILAAALYLFLLFFLNQRVVTVDVSIISKYGDMPMNRE